MPGSKEFARETDDDSANKDDDEDGDDQWVEEGGYNPENLRVEDAISHLRCFAHSLQLVIRDGLKPVKQLTAVLGKCCKISSLLHTSTKFKVIKLLLNLILKHLK